MLSDSKSFLNDFDFIIIGSGISGLVTSLILAKEGKKVAIFEKDKDIAPLIRPYKRKGILIGPGLHVSGWMDKGEVVEKFLSYLNVIDGVEIKLSEQGYGVVNVNGKEYYIPKGYDAIEKSLCSYFPESKSAIQNYFASIKECVSQDFYFNHSLPPTKGFNSTISEYVNFSVTDFFKKNNAPKELIDLINFMSYILVGSRTDEMCFMMHAFVMSGFYESPGYFSTEGISNMLLNFKKELEKLNVKIFLNSEIEEILINEKEKKAVGVKTSKGEEYFSSNVIASFHPKLLLKLVKKNIFRPIFIKRLKEAENTCGFYVSYYKINEEIKLDVNNIVCYDNKDDLLMGMILNEEKKQRVLSVFLPNEGSYPEEKIERDGLAKIKLRVIEDNIYKLYPNLKGNIELLDFLKPWSFERYTNTMDGSAYGIKQKLDSIGFQHKVPIRNLYLVGQSIYPGFLGSLISAFSLGFEVLENDNFWKKVISI